MVVGARQTLQQEDSIFCDMLQWLGESSRGGENKAVEVCIIEEEL